MLEAKEAKHYDKQKNPKPRFIAFWRVQTKDCAS
nr:MAG TPA: hypothetical protein [Caudoviricetes sp.]